MQRKTRLDIDKLHVSVVPRPLIEHLRYSRFSEKLPVRLLNLLSRHSRMCQVVRTIHSLQTRIMYIKILFGCTSISCRCTWLLTRIFLPKEAICWSTMRVFLKLNQSVSCPFRLRNRKKSTRKITIDLMLCLENFLWNDPASRKLLITIYK